MQPPRRRSTRCPALVRLATLLTAGGPAVSYAVTSPTPTTQDVVVDVRYPQVQYTQTVLLNVNGLSWPHVSVANLVPAEPVQVRLP